MSLEKDLSNHRMNQAEQCLKDAKLLFENAGYNGAANRAFYCGSLEEPGTLFSF